MTNQPADQQRAHLMRSIHAALAGARAPAGGVTVELLPECQLLVSKGLVAGSGNGKSPRQVPAGDGYTVYIRVGAADGGGRPQQRSSQSIDEAVSDVATTPLKLDRAALEQHWQLRNRAGDRIVVTVRCGSETVFGEVDGVLATLELVLRAGDAGPG